MSSGSVIAVDGKTVWGSESEERNGIRDIGIILEISITTVLKVLKELYRNNMTVWSCYFLIA
jgi:hypothetical protein